MAKKKEMGKKAFKEWVEKKKRERKFTVPQPQP
jgi:hypothetical protein